MMSRILGKKLHMTQIYRNDSIVPVTVISTPDVEDFSSFKEGVLVKVAGISKGKGFEGVVKRHGFGGGPQSHGQKDRLRAPGSLGATAPQRVLPGRRMAGRMGGDRVTIKNLKIVGFDADKKIIFLKGAVPGHAHSPLEIYFS